MIRVLIVFTIIFLFFTVSYAGIYSYTDENGVVCYTDAPLDKKARMVMKEKAPSRQANRIVAKDSTNYYRLIQEKAAKYNVDPSLVKAMIKVESNWNERAISRKGAMGLMQLMPVTASEMNLYDPFNPEENIEGGTKYLRHLLDRFDGNLNLALAAYNAGPKKVKKCGFIPPIMETKQYVNKVLSIYNNDPSSATERHERIYRVVLQDGSVLFTNSPFLLRNVTGF